MMSTCVDPLPGLLACGVIGLLALSGLDRSARIRANAFGGLARLQQPVQYSRQRTTRTGATLGPRTQAGREPIQDVEPIHDYDIGAKLDLPALGAPISRAVLALGVPDVLKVSSLETLEIVYVDQREELLSKVFRTGGLPLKLNSSHQMPFVDFTFDVVVVGRFWCLDECSHVQVIDEWFRVLRPLGKLILYPDVRLPAVQAHPLVHASSNLSRFKNVLVRTDSNSTGMSICFEPWRGTGGLDRYNPYKFILGEGPLKDRCQSYISPHYEALDSPRRKYLILKDIRKGMSLSKARLKWQNVENLKGMSKVGSRIQPKARVKCGTWEAQNYVGCPNRDGSWRLPVKGEWESNKQLKKLITSGQVKTVIDAGCGSCTLDATLRRSGIRKHLRVWAQFGSYDHSLQRLCSERGTPAFQWDWAVPLPLCKDCRFDLLFQAEGMHHMIQSMQKLSGCKISSTHLLDCMVTTWGKLFTLLFDAVRCEGFLFLNDHQCATGEMYSNIDEPRRGTKMCWRGYLQKWVKAQGHQRIGYDLYRKHC